MTPRTVVLQRIERLEKQEAPRRPPVYVDATGRLWLSIAVAICLLSPYVLRSAARYVRSG